MSGGSKKNVGGLKKNVGGVKREGWGVKEGGCREVKKVSFFGGQ